MENGDKSSRLGGGRRSAYAITSASNPALKTLGLEEDDPEDIFELQNKEGAGAFGRVFRACYRNNPAKVVALKVIPVALEAGQRGEDIENVRREIQFLRECDHPNVVAFYGAYYKDGALWVAMEYCGGGSVGDVSRNRRLAEQEVSVIMRGALHGLGYLHSRKKIHRDIKGGNILLTTNGQVKIADFGVSAQLRDTMSRRGTFVGTPYWMSPEMIQDSDYDYKSDIWSLGITAIELADQKPPLFDEHPMRVLIQIPRNPPPQLQSPSNWTPEFSQFLQFCLRKDPHERPTAVACLSHPFIVREQHIERVFATGRETLLNTKDANVDGNLHIQQAPAAEVPTAASQVGKEIPQQTAPGDDIELIDENTQRKEAPVNDATIVTQPKREDTTADPPMITETFNESNDTDEIAHLEEHNKEEESIDTPFTRNAEAAASAGVDINEDCKLSVHGETFRFRQPRQSTSPVSRPSLLSVPDESKYDELLNLSIDESFELPVGIKKKVDGNNTSIVEQDFKHIQQSRPQINVAACSSQPPTEFKLLPAAAQSPVIRRSNQFFNIQGSKSSAGTPVKPSQSPVIHSGVSQQQHQHQQESHRSRAIAHTPARATAKIGGWQNPLADIDASFSRVNMLRLSVSSLSSSTNQLFSTLTQSEHEENQAEPPKQNREHYVQRSIHQSSLDRESSSSDNLASSMTKSSQSIPLSSNHFIGAPFRVSHNLCVKYNSVAARFEGVPTSEDWLAIHKQFGIALNHLRCRTNSNDQVPALLHMLHRELVQRGGLHCKYIYRISPKQVEVESAKNAIDRGYFDASQVSDLHIYASLIKIFFRELPTPLLHSVVHDDLMKIGKLLNPVTTGNNPTIDTFATAFDAVNDQVQRTLNNIFSQERAVLEWLLDHMLEVIYQTARNSMTAQSLAVIMAPNLYCCTSFVTTPAAASALANHAAALVRVLLAWKHHRRSDSLRLSSLLSVSESMQSSGHPMRESTSISIRGIPVAKSASFSFPSAQSSFVNCNDAFAGDYNNQDFDDFSKWEGHCSLETKVKTCIDDIWNDLFAQQITTLEALHAVKHVLLHIFQKYQRTLLRLVHQFSKRTEEREWAAEILTKLNHGISASGEIIPLTLTKMKRWMRAALCLDDFVELLHGEFAVWNKQKRLRERFSMPDSDDTNDTTRGKTLDPELTHDLIHRLCSSNLYESSRPASCSLPQEQSLENEKSSGHRTKSEQNENVLLSGALHLLELDTSSASERTERLVVAQAIADMGKREPMIGNLLAGLSRCERISQLHLEPQQKQLVNMVQSTLAIHYCLEQSWC